VRWWVVAGAVVACLLACGGLPLPFGPIPLERDLEGPGQMAAAALAARIEGGRYPDEILEACDEHAERLTWLAARHDEGAVLSASLWAMASCADALHPPDARAVAGARLGHEDRGVVGGAMAVAGALLPDLGADDPVIAGLVELASSDRQPLAVRVEALEALDRRPWGQEPAIVGAFVHALHAEGAPVVVATALERLRYRAAGVGEAERPRFVSIVLVLAGDIDPAVRGLAALALARLAPDDEDVRARVLGLLEDDHGYTRSAAAQALADMGYLPAARALVAGLPDDAPNTWQMLAWTRLDGSEDQKRFVGSRFERVDDAWLRALERLTVDLDAPFVYREIDLRYKELDIIAATRDATRWLREHGDAVPER
jgi:hypothetical protein